MSNLFTAFNEICKAFNLNKPNIFVGYNDCLSNALIKLANQVTPISPFMNSCCEYTQINIRNKILNIAKELVS